MIIKINIKYKYIKIIKYNEILFININFLFNIDNNIKKFEIIKFRSHDYEI